MTPTTIKTIKAVMVVFLCVLSVQVNAQESLTAIEWQEDLRFLQETVHSDYSFLFKKVTSEKFDSEVEKLHQEIPSMANHEVMVGFARIVSLFQYGHTRFGFNGGGVKHHKLPINLYYFNDGVYIEGTHSAHKKALGAKLLKIEGVPIKEALKMVEPVVSIENDQFFKAYGLAYLTIPEVLHAQGITKSLKETISVTLEKDGKTFDYSLPSGAPDAFRPIYSMMRQEGDWISAREQGDTPLYLKNLDKIYYYEYLPTEKTVYVRHSQIQDDPSEDIPTFYAGLFDFIENNDVEKLILDVRLNGGGNNYKVKPIITGVIKSDKINKLGGFFVIIGRRTFSASQNLINRLDNYTDVVFVGEPSSENINFYGDNRTVTLPNSKFPVFLSFAWWQDKPQWENGDWTSPHLAVDMSFEQYRTNQDPVLDSALNFSDNNFLLDPMAHLTALFMKGEYEEVKNEATRLVNDPMYQFVDFEAQFNRAAYKMMGGEQHQGAVFVLELTAKLFPDSANAWDSLAEAYWKSNDIVKAKEYYNIAISLDPKGRTGDNGRKMLKEIDKE